MPDQESSQPQPPVTVTTTASKPSTVDPAMALLQIVAQKAMGEIQADQAAGVTPGHQTSEFWAMLVVVLAALGVGGWEAAHHALDQGTVFAVLGTLATVVSTYTGGRSYVKANS